VGVAVCGVIVLVRRVQGVDHLSGEGRVIDVDTCVDDRDRDSASVDPLLVQHIGVDQGETVRGVEVPGDVVLEEPYPRVGEQPFEAGAAHSGRIGGLERKPAGDLEVVRAESAAHLIELSGESLAHRGETSGWNGDAALGYRKRGVGGCLDMDDDPKALCTALEGGSSGRPEASRVVHDSPRIRRRGGGRGRGQRCD